MSSEIRVYGIDGTIVADADAMAGSNFIGLANGVYVVAVGNETRKVIVR